MIRLFSKLSHVCGVVWLLVKTIWLFSKLSNHLTSLIYARLVLFFACGLACAVLREIYKASILAKMKPLFSRLFDVCSNGVLPTLKLVQCIQKMHLQKAIYHECSDPVTKFAPDTGSTLRMVASHFRKLAYHAELREVCLKQALCGLVFRLGHFVHCVTTMLITINEWT